MVGDDSMSARGRKRALLIIGGVVLAGTLVAAAIIAQKPAPGAVGESQAAAPADMVDMEKAMKAYADCMRGHLPNFPEPDGHGLNLRGTGIDPESAEFKAAREACSAVLPPPPPGATRGAHRSGPDEGGMPGRSEAPSGGRTSWEKVVPRGDCACADGSEFFFFDHKGEPTKVVFYLDGGGVCFDPKSCGFQNTPGSGEREGPDYDPNLEGENPSSEGGLLDANRAENPLRGFSFVYVPLCTADAHLGNATQKYSESLTVRHKGLVNGTAALNYMAQQYPGAASVVVIGHTAGGAAAPLYGGLATDLLPNARVTVLASQAAAFPDDPSLNARLGELWGSAGHMPDWFSKGGAKGEWGTRQMTIQAGLHSPNITLARFDFAYDPHAKETLKYLALDGVDPENTLGIIDANESAIESAGVNLHSYTAPGNGHGILEFELFYELETNGVKLVNWVGALVDGHPMPDVR